MGESSLRADLKGKTAVVTGAGRGIGRSIALTLARNGADVAVVEINEENGESVAEEARACGVRARAYGTDVSDPKQVNELEAQVSEAFGDTHILINNAGINVGPEGRKPVHEFAYDDWDRIIHVDLYGPFHFVQAFSKGMVERKQGKIVNIASIVGVVPLRMQSAFAAAKAGLINFTRAAALELGPHNINVNAIAPGSIVTQGTKKMFYSDPTKSDSLLSHVALGRPGTTDEIAQAALFLASDGASYVTGAVLVVDGGWTSGYHRDW